jgi:hypothetical protein
MHGTLSTAEASRAFGSKEARRVGCIFPDVGHVTASQRNAVSAASDESLVNLYRAGRFNFFPPPQGDGPNLN